MKKQSDSGFPKPIASQSGYTIVQFRKDFVAILDNKKLEHAGIKAGTDLPKFTEEGLDKKLLGLELGQITNRIYLTYGSRGQMVYVFNIPGVEEKLCMSKTPFNKIFKAKDKSADFMTGAKTMTYEDLRKEDKGNEENEGSEEDEENEKSKKKSIESKKNSKESKKKSKESKKKKEKDRDSSDTEMGGWTDNEGNDNGDEEHEEDNSENGDEDDENITLSIEQNVRGKERKLRRLEQSLGKTGSKKTGSNNRKERYTSLEISGNTPAPETRTDGTILYAMEGTCFGQKIQRGLLEINGSYEFERVENCPANLILPNQFGGMAPFVDDQFVSKLDSSHREKFNILGCTAKWHRRPNKQVIVILEFKKDDSFSRDLKTLRTDKGYSYKGPVVCRYNTFKKIMEQSDLQVLQGFLDKTELGKSANEYDRDINTKECTNTQLMEKLDKLEGIIKKAKL